MVERQQLPEMTITGLNNGTPYMTLRVRCRLCGCEVVNRTFDVRRDEAAAEAFGERDSDVWLEHLRTHGL